MTLLSNQREQEIRLYMFLRLIMLASVLSSVVSGQLSGAMTTQILFKTYSIIIVNFLVSTVFVFIYQGSAIELQSNSRRAAFFLGTQVGYDVLFTTLLIFFTGSNESIYIVFYLLNILFTAIVFRTRGALITALASGVLYVSICALNMDRVMGDKLFSISTTVSAFAATGLLSGQLVEELKKTRAKISRLERLNDEIVESLDSGLLGIDANDRLQKINRTAGELLGVRNMSSVMGKPIREVFPALNLKTLNRNQTGEIRELTIRGRPKRILVTQLNFMEDHRLILLRDLSEVLSLETQVRRQDHLAGIGRLAAGVAHEIRNPIAAISGSAQLLAQITGELNPETRKLIEIVVKESDRVSRLVDQLLRFARPGATKKETVNLSAIVQDCIDALKTREDFITSHANLTLNISSDIVVMGNRDELHEVVNSLLVNALEALSEKTVDQERKIEVACFRNEDVVELIVSDNGPGIPREFRERIFDPFFTTKPSGTGLGLAQVYKIVRDHEGQVDVDTELGRGTALRIKLPA